MKAGGGGSANLHPLTGGSIPAGTWWLDDTGKRRPANDTRSMGMSLVERRYAFKYLGLVEIDVAPAVVKIAWDVRSVELGSLISAFHAVSEFPIATTVFLDIYLGGWNREVYADRNRALERMGSLAGFRNAEPYSAVKLTRRDATGVRNEGSMIRTAFETWDRSGGRFTWNPDSRYAAVARVSLMFKPDRKGESLQFMHVGGDSAAVRVFGKDWARSAIGRDAWCSQPDYEFDDRVCDAYEIVLRTGEPYVDHVRAPIRRTGADPVWVPYRRLVVPAKTAKGEPVVMSICDVRQDIAIPFMIS